MPTEFAPVVSPRPSTTRRGGMFRALSHRNYPSLLDWSVSFECRHVDAGSRAGLARVAFDQLAILARARRIHGDGARVLSSHSLGGVFADRIDRRRLLLYTQVVAGLAALGLAALVATDVVNRWMVLGFSFVTGCCMALASPSYLAMTYDLVGREDLANAIAMNSTQFQLSRVVGPALAGVAFRVFGLAGCFFANGLSFIAVVAALWMVRPQRRSNARDALVKERRAFWRDLIEGLRYVRNRPRVSSLLLLSAVNSLFGAPYFSMVPIYARDIFHLGETGLALLMGTAGGGAFLGALAGCLSRRLQEKRLVCARRRDRVWYVHHWLRAVFTVDVVVDVSFWVGFRARGFDRAHQHAAAKARDRPDARSRDEHVYSFVHGHDADWQHRSPAPHPTISARSAPSLSAG